MSRAISLFGAHVCDWCCGPRSMCARQPEAYLTRKQRRAARRYEARQQRRRRRRLERRKG